MRIRVSRYDLFISMVLLLSLHVDSFEYILPFGFLFRWFPLFIAIIYICLLVFRKRRISLLMLGIVIFFSLFLISTLIHNPATFKNATRILMPPLCVAVVTDYYMGINPIKYLNAAVKLLVLLLVLDIISIIAFPNGLYESSLYTENWLLGYKTARVYAVGFPLIVFSGVLDVYQSKKLSVRFYLISILCLIDTLLSKGTGGLVSLILLSLMIIVLFVFKSNSFRRFFTFIVNPKVMIPAIAVLDLFLAVFQKFDFLEFFIVGILKKSMTLTNRTKIWSVSLELFKKSPIIGQGYIFGTDFIEMTGVRGGTQPHNQLLSILVYTGLFGLLVYSVVIWLALRKGEYQKPVLSTIAMCGIMANLILGLASMNILGQWHYAMYLVLYYLRIIEKDMSPDE